MFHVHEFFIYEKEKPLMLLIINCDALSILFRHMWIYQHRVSYKRLRISSSLLFSILFHVLSDSQCYDKHI